MKDALDIPPVAALLADPARASMAWTLIDGTTRPAGELAFVANVSAPSASAHLAKLVEGGLLVAESQGRHRYFRIAGADAGHLIESLASFGAKGGTDPRFLLVAEALERSGLELVVTPQACDSSVLGREIPRRR